MRTWNIADINFNVVRKYNGMLTYHAVLGVLAVEGYFEMDKSLSDLEAHCVMKTLALRHDIWKWKGQPLIHGWLRIEKTRVIMKVRDLYERRRI